MFCRLLCHAPYKAFVSLASHCLEKAGQATKHRLVERKKTNVNARHRSLRSAIENQKKKVYAFQESVPSTREGERGGQRREPARRARPSHRLWGGVPPLSIAAMGKLKKQNSVQIRRAAFSITVTGRQAESMTRNVV